MSRALLILGLVLGLWAPAAAQPVPVAPIAEVEVRPPPYDDGRHLRLSFERAAGELTEVATVIVRRPADAVIAPPALVGKKLKAGDELDGATVVAVLEAGEREFTDQVAPGRSHRYWLYEVRRDDKGVIVGASPAVDTDPATPVAAWFNLPRLPFLIMIAVIAILFAIYLRRAKVRPEDVYIRRMPGVDAIEDAVGRSTEMGRPVL